VTRPSTESLLAELARDVEPVRPIPPLRAGALAILGVWGAGAALYWSFMGTPGLEGLADPNRRGIAAALAVAAAGGLAATLARAVPGRERTERLGAAGLAAGFLLAVFAVGGAWIATGASDGGSPSLAFACLGRAALLALAPALLALGWLVRAWDVRPAVGGLVASLMAAALGALVVHTSCAQAEASHMLVGHVVGPVAVAGLLALLVAPWLRFGRARLRA